MTAPAVQSRTTSTNAATTSHTINYPATVDAGDMLLLIIGFDNRDENEAPIPSDKGWVELGGFIRTDSAQLQSCALVKIADGTEDGSTFTLTSTSTQESSAIMLRITGHNPELLPYHVGSETTGSSSTPDPPSITPPWGSQDYLWVAYANCDLATVNSGPSGYSNFTAADQGAVCTGTAEKTSTASSEDAGTFALSAGDQWQAGTVAIPPATYDPYDGYAAVQDREITYSAAGSTSHTINYPRSVSAGDVLLLVAGQDNPGATPSVSAAGFTEVSQTSSDSGGTGTGSVLAALVAYKVATGSEGGSTFTVTTDSTGAVIAAVYKITGADSSAITATFNRQSESGSRTIDPPSHDAGVSGNFLWITGAVSDDGIEPALNPTSTGTISGFWSAAEIRYSGTVFGWLFESAQAAQTVNPGTFAVRHDANPLEPIIGFTISVGPSASTPEPFDEITPGIQFAFGQSPLAASPTWTDVSDYVIAFSFNRGRSSLRSRFEAGTGTIVLDNTDGRFDPNNSSSPYSPDVTLHCPTRIVITHNGTDYPIFRGMVEAWPLRYGENAQTSWVEVPIVDLTKILAGFGFDAAAISAARLPGGDLEGPVPVSGWITDVLNSTNVNWPAGLQSIETSVSDIYMPEEFSGSAADAIYDGVECEAGAFFVANDGTATFHNRVHHAGGLSSSGTFGPGTGEIAFEDIELSYDDDTLFNRVFAESDTSMFNRQVDGDSTSISAFGEYRTTISAPFTSPAAADNIAEWTVAKFKDQKVRIKGLTFSPQFDEANAWPQALGRDLRDAIRVKFTPPGGGDSLDQTCTIERITHRVDARQGTYWVSWGLEPLSTVETNDYWILGTDQLDTGTRVA